VTAPIDHAPIDHVERTRVAWVDTDAGGRIHFTAAFRWAEMAETGIRRKLGLIEGWGSYPRRKVEAEFLQVLVFEDEIEVRIRPEHLGETSITWGFAITRHGELCVRGTLVVVHVDGGGRPAALTEQERAALTPPST
jgi:acyl-CoA thioesterase FadM